MKDLNLPIMGPVLGILDGLARRQLLHGVPNETLRTIADLSISGTDTVIVLKTLYQCGAIPDMDPDLESFLKTLPNIENSVVEAEKYCEELRAILRRKNDSTSKPPKMIEIDSYPGGFPSGQMAVFFARGSQKKSSLVSKLLREELARRGHLDAITIGKSSFKNEGQRMTMTLEKQRGQNDSSAFYLDSESELGPDKAVDCSQEPKPKPKHSGYPGSRQYGSAKKKGKAK